MKAAGDSIPGSFLLEKYFHQYFALLHRYAYNILRDDDEAKDVVQGIFLQLWQRKDIIAIDQSVRSYLYTATHNNSLNSIRNRKTRVLHQGNFVNNKAYVTDMQEEIEAKQTKKEILAAMYMLPDKCRYIFYKSRFEEKTYTEIAAELNISVKTVETQITKALRILRDVLSDPAH